MNSGRKKAPAARAAEAFGAIDYYLLGAAAAFLDFLCPFLLLFVLFVVPASAAGAEAAGAEAAGASAAIGAGAAIAPAATPTASRAEAIIVTGLFMETPDSGGVLQAH
jgi:hypothetical protein